MTDINAVIAYYRGWRRYGTDKSSYWMLDGAGPLEKPDFQGDPRLYMALFEEMKNSGFEFRLESDTAGRGEAVYTATILEQRNDTKGTGWNMKVISTQLTIGGAICQAYCKLHGLECEG